MNQSVVEVRGRSKRSPLGIGFVIGGFFWGVWGLWNSWQSGDFLELSSPEGIAVLAGALLIGVPAVMAGRRTGVFLSSHQVIVRNGFKTTELSIATSKVEVVDTIDRSDGQTRPRLRDEPVVMTRSLVIDDGEQRVTVDAASGLVPSKLDQLVVEIETAITDARWKLRSPES